MSPSGIPHSPYRPHWGIRYPRSGDPGGRTRTTIGPSVRQRPYCRGEGWSVRGRTAGDHAKGSGHGLPARNRRGNHVHRRCGVPFHRPELVGSRESSRWGCAGRPSPPCSSSPTTAPWWSARPRSDARLTDPTGWSASSSAASATRPRSWPAAGRGPPRSSRPGWCAGSSTGWPSGRAARPTRIAITHPASWGPHKKDLLAGALGAQGLTRHVPGRAAGRSAALRRRRAGRAGSTIAVYDLGGGTFDAAVVRKADGVPARPASGCSAAPRAWSGSAASTSTRWCSTTSATACPTRSPSLDDTDPAVLSAVARIRRECTEAKEALSSDTEVSIPVLLPASRGSVRLHRSEFEALIRPQVEETVAALRRAVRSAGLAPEQLTAVLLVGGSSRIPLVAPAGVRAARPPGRRGRRPEERDREGRGAGHRAASRGPRAARYRWPPRRGHRRSPRSRCGRRRSGRSRRRRGRRGRDAAPAAAGSGRPARTPRHRPGSRRSPGSRRRTRAPSGRRPHRRPGPCTSRRTPCSPATTSPSGRAAGPSRRPRARLGLRRPRRPPSRRQPPLRPAHRGRRGARGGRGGRRDPDLGSNRTSNASSDTPTETSTVPDGAGAAEAAADRAQGRAEADREQARADPEQGTAGTEAHDERGAAAGGAAGAGAERGRADRHRWPADRHQRRPGRRCRWQRAGRVRRRRGADGERAGEGRIRTGVGQRRTRRSPGVANTMRIGSDTIGHESVTIMDPAAMSRGSVR